MEILFYVLCATFFLSLFILKFKWFKKIGQWLAKPFVAIMKRKRNAKITGAAKDDAGNRAKISQMQLRPVVLPPQLNAPKKEEKQEAPKASAEEKKPVTMKEAFGGKDPFATRPIFPMAQVDYEKQTQSPQSPFGTKFAQNLPNVQPKVQNRTSLDFLNADKKTTLSASPFVPVPKDAFAMPKGSERNLGSETFLSEKPGQNRFNFDRKVGQTRSDFDKEVGQNSFDFNNKMGQNSLGIGAKMGQNSFVFDKKMGQNAQNFNNKFGQNPFATGGATGRNLTFSNVGKGQDLSFLTAGKDRSANAKARNFADKSSQDMDAIIAKRKREFDDYKRQKDSMEIDGQDVDIAGLPPKLKRILVMGILDRKKYD